MAFEFAAVDRTRQHDPVQMWPFWIDCSLSEIARWAAQLKMKNMVRKAEKAAGSIDEVFCRKRSDSVCE